MDGKSTQDIRRAVMREFGVSYNNADRLVRTEVSYVHNQMTLARYKENGDSLVKILIVEDGKACEICRELPGRLQTRKGLQVGQGADRRGQIENLSTAPTPYDINAAPFLPAHPRCRCCYAPWTYSDRKNWEKEHPEEGLEPEEKPELPELGEAPKPLQNQGFSGIMEVEKTDAPDWPSMKKAAEQIGSEAFGEYLKQTPIEQVVDANRVVEEAIRIGGRHHGKVENVQLWQANSVVKAVRSSRARVDEHRMKIENPSEYDAGWNEKDEGMRIGLLVKWRKDQRRNYELLLVFTALAKSRGLL